tara:strand:+ start:290 stop:994 length:705 start_codon:yes stop_codon:yes gene_type:complete
MGLGSSFGIAAETGNNIVTDGLVFYVDAAYKKSYAGSGTTWVDIVGGVDGTLTNGASFSTVGGGCIDFDGSNDYCAFTLPAMGTDSFTMDLWVKQDTFTNWQTWVSTTRSSTGFNIGTDADGDVVFYDGARRLEADGVMDPDDDGAGTGIFRHCAYTRDASNSNAAVAYMDGVSVDTGTISSNQTQTAGSIGDLDRGSERTNGQIALFRMYKGIAFTSNQVKQNYHAGKERFGF